MARYEKECRVGNIDGLHARPFGLIKDMVVAGTPPDQLGIVFIRRPDEKVRYDASQMNELMTLAAGYNTPLVVLTDKKEYIPLVDKVADLIDNMPAFN